MSKVDLWELFEDGLVDQGSIVDVSSYDEWKKLFEASANFLQGPTPDHIKDLFHTGHFFDNSKKANEVLIKWRGRLPKKYFTVPSISSSTV